MSIIAVIPARGGSKGIPRKNLVALCGRPLIAYSIDAARQASCIDRVLVSTDDPEIARVARELGAEVPFLRPPELSGDEVPMLAVLCHAWDWCMRELGPVEALVLLQPTSPLRRAGHIDSAVALFRAESPDSVVSVVEVPHQFNPVSVMRLEDGRLCPFLPDAPPVYRRQDKPRVYARNGPAVLVTAPATLAAGALYGSRCLPLFMSARESLDIDTMEDLAEAEAALSRAKGGGS